MGRKATGTSSSSGGQREAWGGSLGLCSCCAVELFLVLILISSCVLSGQGRLPHAQSHLTGSLLISREGLKQSRGNCPMCDLPLLSHAPCLELCPPSGRLASLGPGLPPTALRWPGSHSAPSSSHSQASLPTASPHQGTGTLQYLL